MAKNYLKVFRMRRFADYEERGNPDERYFFFDDADPKAVASAAANARGFSLTRPRSKISAWRPIVGVSVEIVGE